MISNFSNNTNCIHTNFFSRYKIFIWIITYVDKFIRLTTKMVDYFYIGLFARFPKFFAFIICNYYLIKILFYS